ncbi:MAG: M67 family metallopeptidase [Alphaproteobacteria bacterium]
MTQPKPRAVTQMRLAPSLLRYLESLTKSANEQCGLLIGRIDGEDAIIDELRVMPNSAPTPATSFEIDPGLRLKVQRQLRGTNRRVIGIYHTHPQGTATPSKHDHAGACLEPGLVWLIAAQAGIAAYIASADGLAAIRLQSP